MKIPNEWIKEIIDAYDKSYAKSYALMECNKKLTKKQILGFLNNSLNKKWDYIPYQQEMFKLFLIKTVLHQLNPYVHQMTCGVNSNHDYLIPRIMQNDTPYLVCPTCGYVQLHIPL